MNNNSWFYVKKGFSLAFNGIVRKINNYLKYYIFMIAYILSSLCIFGYPLFSLANHKINKMIINDEDVNLFDSFDNVEKSKKYSKYLYIIVISIFIVLGVIFGGFLIYLCLELLITSIFGQASVNNSIPLIIACSILLYIGLVCFFTYVNIKLLAVPIILNENTELNVTNTVKESFKLTKGIFFKLLFINLIISIFLILYILIIYLLIVLAAGNQSIASIIIFFVFLLLIILLLALPVIFLAVNTSTTLAIYDNSKLENKIESKENEEIIEELFKELEESANE